MSKRIKVVVSVLVAVVLLAMGGAATVMAQDEAPTPTLEPTARGRLAAGMGPQIEPGKFRGCGGGNMTRVAEILQDICPGITVDDLEAAFNQARQEMRQAAFDNALAKAVAEGRIEADEAAAIAEWWGERPGVLELGQFQRALGGRGGPMWGGKGGHKGHKGHKGSCNGPGE